MIKVPRKSNNAQKPKTITVDAATLRRLVDLALYLAIHVDAGMDEHTTAMERAAVSLKRVLDEEAFRLAVEAEIQARAIAARQPSRPALITVAPDPIPCTCDAPAAAPSAEVR